MTFLNSYTYSSQVLLPCLIVLSCSIFLSSSNVSPKLFLIFVNSYFTGSTSDSLLASSSSKLSFYASTISPCTYDNTQATWVIATSSIIFILMYRQATLTNTLTFSIFPLKTWGLATSTLLPCCWRSIVLTCCYRVAIMVRSCSSLVWWGAGVKGGFPYCYWCWWDICNSSGDDDNDGDSS